MDMDDPHDAYQGAAGFQAELLGKGACLLGLALFPHAITQYKHPVGPIKFLRSG
jgi:hypothetical protein